MLSKKLTLRCLLEREKEIVYIFESNNEESIRLVYKKSEILLDLKIGEEYILNLSPNKSSYSSVQPS